MNIRNFVLTAILFFTVFFCVKDIYAEPSDAGKNQVIVYYLHTNFRCTNCYNIEKWTKEVIEKDFKDDISSGKLVLNIVNYEEKNNAHFAEKYKLYTKSVVLSLIKDGKELKWVNLTKVWDFLRSKEKMQAYIKEEVQKYLKEV